MSINSRAVVVGLTHLDVFLSFMAIPLRSLWTLSIMTIPLRPLQTHITAGAASYLDGNLSRPFS